MTLTAKQEAFCQAMMSCDSSSEAYRKAYDTKDMLPASVHRKAKELMDNVKIAARLAELRAPVIERAQLSLEEHLNDLKTLRDKAAAKSQFAAAITAEIARGRAAGHYGPKMPEPPAGGLTVPEDYTLSPDENVPDAPIL
ncbi:terminase small subunit [Dyadobacter sp. 32]|uniref:terminase small subunit n=1 Tax=Dyadobacter sp. 32 TaxID=538966 RepID=UPI0011F09128